MDTTTANRQQTVEAFAEVMASLNRGDQHIAALRALTFWCGAGFSKAWNPQSPTEGSLFRISKEQIATFNNLSHVLEALGWDDNDGIGFEGFKTLTYVIEMQLKYPDIRNRYLDENNLRFSISEIRTFIQNRFEQLCDLDYVSPRTGRFDSQADPSRTREALLAFFEGLVHAPAHAVDSSDDPTVHFVTTNYEFTVETILDNIGARAVPVLGSLYRGISPHRVCGRSIWEHPRTSFRHNLIKLNGGFEILRDGEGYELEYRTRRADDVRESPPILILPSRDQDYSEPYYREIFPKAVRVLRETSVLVVVGYSMPREDALIRFVLRQLADSGADARGKYIFCIDLKGPEILDARLRWTFHSVGRIGWPKVHYYSGRFEDFCLDYAAAK